MNFLFFIRADIMTTIIKRTVNTLGGDKKEISLYYRLGEIENHLRILKQGNHFAISVYYGFRQFLFEIKGKKHPVPVWSINVGTRTYKKIDSKFQPWKGCLALSYQIPERRLL